jgi:conjugative relaxase-like TrwC/TraI family protein
MCAGSEIDVTFSAPKSVSVAYALLPGFLAPVVRDAHTHAVRESLRYLEQVTARAARGHHGDGQTATRIDTDGLIGVAFDHRSSRAGDPQLHTHVVLANLARGTDGRWSALDTRARFRHATTASYLYQAVLRGRLTTTLGVRWTQVEQGIAEIRDVPQHLCQVFSQRRAAIQAELTRTGRTGPAAAQHACLTTRPAKQHLAERTLRGRWAATARRLGIDVSGWDRQVCHRVFIPPELPATGDLAQRLLSADGLTRTQTSFDARDVIQAVCAELTPGTPVDTATIGWLTGQLLTHPDTRPLTTRHDSDEKVFSTRELLAVERHAVQLATDHQHHRVAQVPEDTIDQLLVAECGRGHPLPTEQARAVRHLAGSGRPVDLLVGPAGTGKTSALMLAHRCWQRADIPVLGAALAANTAHRLHQTTGISAASIARLLADLDRADPATGRPAGLARGSVLVVDEASMVGTRTLARLLEHTRTAGGKLVLVGDPRQLPEIDAGGLFTALTRALPAVHLDRNRRQAAEWERDALGQLRAGDLPEALAALKAHGRIRTADTAAELRDRLVDDYLTAVQHGRDAVILTTSRTDAHQLNQTVRDRLAAHGRLGSDQLTVGTGGHTRGFRVGDQVLITRNDPAACSTAPAPTSPESTPIGMSSRCKPTTEPRTRCRPAGPPTGSTTATRSPATKPKASPPTSPTCTARLGCTGKPATSACPAAGRPTTCTPPPTASPTSPTPTPTTPGGPNPTGRWPGSTSSCSTGSPAAAPNNSPSTNSSAPSAFRTRGPGRVGAARTITAATTDTAGRSAAEMRRRP